MHEPHPSSNVNNIYHQIRNQEQLFKKLLMNRVKYGQIKPIKSIRKTTLVMPNSRVHNKGNMFTKKEKVCIIFTSIN
ncbi:hypothetical protein Hanom_Chr13g01212411 [Helianthus anomalus]